MFLGDLFGALDGFGVADAHDTWTTLELTRDKPARLSEGLTIVCTVAQCDFVLATDRTRRTGDVVAGIDRLPDEMRYRSVILLW
jgi:hypothetical protein